MRMTLRLAAVVCAAILGQAAIGGTLTLTASYTLGESDSRMSAREHVLAIIKSRAADQAGTYIEHDSRIDPRGELNEQVRMISASLIKVSPLNENLSTNQAGVSTLEVTAQVDIDDATLRQRIVALQTDQSKAGEIERLAALNLHLRQEIQGLYTQLSIRMLDPDTRTALLLRENHLQADMISNGQAVDAVFSKGSLLAMADREEEDEKKVAEKFRHAFIETWRMMSGELHPEIESARPVDGGVELTIHVEGTRPLFHEIPALIGFDDAYVQQSPDPQSPNQHDYFDIAKLKKQQNGAFRLFALKAPVLAELPVSLELCIGNTSHHYDYFGFRSPSTTAVFLDPASHAEDSVEGLRQVMGGQITFGFQMLGHRPIKVRLTKQEAAEAGDVRAQFVIGRFVNRYGDGLLLGSNGHCG